MSKYRLRFATFINLAMSACCLERYLVSQSGAIQLRHKQLLIASYQRRQSNKETLLQSALKGNKEAENSKRF